MSKIVVTVIIWLAWLFTALSAALSAHYLSAGHPTLNSFQRPFDVYAFGLFFIPIIICGGLRFWLSRIRNRWIALFACLIGMYVALNAGMFGIYLLPEYCILFQVLGAALLIAFFPFFVRLKVIPPPLPESKDSTATGIGKK